MVNPITTPSKSSSAKPLALTAGTLALIFGGVALSPAATAAPENAPADTGWAAGAYRGSVEVVEGPDADQETIDGSVFDDQNKNSVQDNGERGLGGVTVSNGRDVVTTDSQGRYELPAFENMTVFATQPRGYQVPVDENNVAQFYYHHLPEGSPDLEHGGIAPTGPLPDAVNFPLAKSSLTQSPEQHCLIGGDIQTYTEEQVPFARAGVFADLADRNDYAGCGALFIGDVVGDDPGLYPQTRELTSMINGPARFLPGNHDLDFDAASSEHSFDSFRANLGPEYYSYDAGKTHVVALNTVEYQSGTPYNGALDERQLEWLRNDIAQVPENKLIVLAAHIPLLDYADQGSSKHQVDQVKEIYKILEGREVVALGGHTHSIENLREGDSLAGWSDVFGVDGLPFTHITAGAISGDWYSGRMLPEGYPLAVQRDGGLPGVLTLDIKNTEVKERFTVRGEDDSLQMALGLNTPRYRGWYAENVDNKGSAPEFTDALTVSQEELANQTWLTTNFWMGSTGSTVDVKIDGGDTAEAVRTQQMQGEGQLVGAEWSDPTAVQEQLVHGGSLADRMMHLWRLELPTDLAVGEHTAEVTATDVHGREFTETLTFQVTQ
ncbi:calcineurin-like phosphoesterase C-terminal domain-containing protein [Arthrobacter crystallopoietes]|uniref:calcineurin-like phosphoesterase C-terminal domain-containing protein n=1 Tax=Crystallibacter crystallopoietes TaxID=37928 RepID=UPI001ABDE9C1|nr:calcineurin-like phosphoesterase family protein [Arthrobacter crystallopoietes]QTG79603.1 calcineurin-like phosphoesterase C-terminal domain-containing protein [Arthrobacter crystallopoietes]